MTQKGEAESFIKWFSELNNKDVLIAGGKGASLSEMYKNKFPIPPGFVVTAQSYDSFVDKTGIRNEVNSILSKLDIEKNSDLVSASKKIRGLFNTALMPLDMQESIIEAYEILSVDKDILDQSKQSALNILKKTEEPNFVAVRSSAIGEFSENASFAGQQESFLNVKGPLTLINKIKACFSSIFTPRSIYYRAKKGFSNDKAKSAVVVQKMVNSDKSGVIFSSNLNSSKEVMIIEAVWGLGKGIVSGIITPDYYAVAREIENLNILEKKIADKKIAISGNSSGRIEIVQLKEEKSKQEVLSDYEIKILAQYALKLEKHYSKPQDIEFAILGKEIFIVQSRPIYAKITEFIENTNETKPILIGRGVYPRNVSGIIKVVNNLKELENVKNGDILVASILNSDIIFCMQKASAIIANTGGVTSPAAIISREIGLPLIVGAENATERLHDGMIVTLDSLNGKVYEQTREKEKTPEIFSDEEDIEDILLKELEKDSDT